MMMDDNNLTAKPQIIRQSLHGRMTKEALADFSKGLDRYKNHKNYKLLDYALKTDYDELEYYLVRGSEHPDEIKKNFPHKLGWHGIYKGYAKEDDVLKLLEDETEIAKKKIEEARILFEDDKKEDALKTLKWAFFERIGWTLHAIEDTQAHGYMATSIHGKYEDDVKMAKLNGRWKKGYTFENNPRILLCKYYAWQYLNKVIFDLDISFSGMLSLL
jgi:hypothetical protein